MSAPKLTAAQARALAMVADGRWHFESDFFDGRIGRKLAAAGLIKRITHKRTTVAITPAGRAALAAHEHEKGGAR